MEQPEAPKKIKQPPVLFRKTQTAIANITSLLGGPVIACGNNDKGPVCHTVD